MTTNHEPNEDAGLDDMMESRLSGENDLYPAGEEDAPYDGGGWPGDGSGTDDLADYNASEADDYRDE